MASVPQPSFPFEWIPSSAKSGGWCSRAGQAGLQPTDNEHPGDEAALSCGDGVCDDLVECGEKGRYNGFGKRNNTLGEIGLDILGKGLQQLSGAEDQMRRCGIFLSARPLA